MNVVQSTSTNNCEDGSDPCDVYGTSSLPKNDMTVDENGNLIGLVDIYDVPDICAFKIFPVDNGNLNLNETTKENEIVTVYVYSFTGMLITFEKLIVQELSIKKFESMVNQTGIYIFKIQNNSDEPIYRKIFIEK